MVLSELYFGLRCLAWEPGTFNMHVPRSNQLCHRTWAF